MEKLENNRSKRITNRSKSKKILLQSNPVKRTINLLGTSGISYCLKLTKR